MEDGFFKLKRSFFSHWLWDQDRVYNQGEAFLDLLQLAAFAPIKRVVKGKLINVPVGGIVASERFLSERWSWSRTKVRQFQSLLVQDGMLEPQKDQGQTVLILSNYAKHADPFGIKKTTKKPVEDHLETSGEPNEKKGKKVKNKNGVSKIEGGGGEPPKTLQLTPPTINEFSAYLITEMPKINADWNESRVQIAAKLQFETYDDNGWKDGNNKQIKNWKLKAKNALAYKKPWNYGNDSSKIRRRAMPARGGNGTQEKPTNAGNGIAVAIL